MARTHASLRPLFGLIAAVCFTPVVVAAPVELAVETVQAAEGGEARVPILLRNPQGVGALQFHLVYDPKVLEWKDAEIDPGAGAATPDFKLVEPGRVRVAIIFTDKGVEKDRTLLTARFAVTGSAGTPSPLAVEVPRAWTHDDIVEMSVSAQPGKVEVTPPEAEQPLTGPNPMAILIGCGVAVVIVVVILLVVRGRGRRDRT